MSEALDAIRRAMTEEINSRELERDALEEKYGKVWDTKELQEDFRVIGFFAPFAAVERKSDGVNGAVMFQHFPRYYFDFTEEK